MSKAMWCGVMVAAIMTSAAMGEGGPIKVDEKTTIGKNPCAKIAWTDAAGKVRTAGILVEGGKDKNLGGYIVDYTYFAGDTLRTLKGGTGFGYIVMHGAHPRGWANSTIPEDSKKVVYSLPIHGANHVVYRAVVDVATVKGTVPVTVDYFFRTGRSDFVYAITFDSKDTHPTKPDDPKDKGLVADTRTPYVDWDWEGNGNIGGDLSGCGWASANKQFRTTDDKLSAKSSWDWTKDCVIPHIIEWKSKDMGDAEIGLVQTQTYAQHDAGSGWWLKAVGTKGKGLCENWNFTYQLNAYQGYSSKRVTWMMPYGAVGSEAYDVFDYKRKASGKPWQCYALLCVLDRYSDGGVDASVAEMETVQTQCKLTATTGAVALKGPAGAGRTDEAAYAPAGWDQVYAMWTVACAGNAAACNLEIAEGTLAGQTFSFTGYTAAAAPKSVSLNGKTLAEGKDYFASLDAAGKRVLITIAEKLTGPKNLVEIK